MKRKICVVTGSRAEYGLLRPLLEEIGKDKDMRQQLIVTGAHLSAEFGFTYKEIEKDGFSIDARIRILSKSDSPADISRSMASAIMGCAEAYKRLKPDIVTVLGDRFEIFSAVAAAHIAGIPVAHIHGGELTEGAFDDAFRHSITKMSHLHFTAAEIYRKRVIQLGESPGRVFNVGAIGLDSIRNMKLLSKRELERELNFKFNKHNLLVTFHPATMEADAPEKQFEGLLAVLRGLDDVSIIFTKSNADPGGRAINGMIDAFASKNPLKAVVFASLGHLKYLSMMHFVDAVAGNSSSGIIEAPSFRVGTINIGDRQRGRIRSESVIDCEPTERRIKIAFKKLYSKKFQENLKTVKNPHGDGCAAKKIKGILKNYGLRDIMKKAFHDIDFKIKG